MNTPASRIFFQPRSSDGAGVSSGAHLGHLNMTRSVRATVRLARQLIRIDDRDVWEAEISGPSEGFYLLYVSFEDATGKAASDEIRIALRQPMERASVQRDHDNALEAWPEHGLLGKQLGPNKNGRKW